MYTLIQQLNIARIRFVHTAMGTMTLLLMVSSGQVTANPLDSLQNYAQQCDMATGGVSVPDFDCDAGTEVPGQGNVFSGNNASVTCDEPNRLNRQCDPGSKFQVLANKPNAIIVAHCRHEGGPPRLFWRYCRYSI